MSIISRRPFARSTEFLSYILILAILFAGASHVYATGTEITSFNSPLAATIGGTGQTSYAVGDILYAPTTTTVGKLADVATGQVLASGGANTAPAYTANPTVASVTLSGNTASSFTYSDASKVVATTSAPTNGELLIGDTGNVPAKAALTQGAGITITNGAHSITIAANGGGTKTVTAKATAYTVLTGDSGVVFTNTGAAGSVTFTLPTAAAGLTYTFYTDATQNVVLQAGASTTIRIGNNVSSSAGTLTNGVIGGTVTIVAISTTQWVAYCSLGTWTAG